ncbi:hypothetical protein HDV00_010007 [Rhizophlyctis rosea]|nr:hypothetical protein HDV00_010007 [Rhizophlyctis rosea]
MSQEDSLDLKIQAHWHPRTRTILRTYALLDDQRRLIRSLESTAGLLRGAIAELDAAEAKWKRWYRVAKGMQVVGVVLLVVSGVCSRFTVKTMLRRSSRRVKGREVVGVVATQKDKSPTLPAEIDDDSTSEEQVDDGEVVSRSESSDEEEGFSNVEVKDRQRQTNLSRYSTPIIRPKTAPTIVLENAKLWSHFHAVQNEMIVTKAGRCLFPTLRFRALHFDPTTLYSIGIDVVQCDPYKYKFKNKTWRRVEHEVEERWCPPRVSAYIVPEGPKKGTHWKKHGIPFTKIKLTNLLSTSSSSSSPSIPSSSPCGADSETDPQADTTDLPAGHFYLHSFHKYQPRVHLFTHGRGGLVEEVTTFVWKETSFIAVTHYQNGEVKALKKWYNPHAKGFKIHGPTSAGWGGRKSVCDVLSVMLIYPPPPFQDYETKLTASKLKTRSSSASSSTMTTTTHTPTGLPTAVYDTTNDVTHRYGSMLCTSSSHSTLLSASPTSVTEKGKRKAVSKYDEEDEVLPRRKRVRDDDDDDEDGEGSETGAAGGKGWYSDRVEKDKMYDSPDATHQTYPHHQYPYPSSPPPHLLLPPYTSSPIPFPSSTFYPGTPSPGEYTPGGLYLHAQHLQTLSSLFETASQLHASRSAPSAAPSAAGAVTTTTPSHQQGRYYNPYANLHEASGLDILASCAALLDGRGGGEV